MKSAKAKKSRKRFGRTHYHTSLFGVAAGYEDIKSNSRVVYWPHLLKREGVCIDIFPVATKVKRRASRSLTCAHRDAKTLISLLLPFPVRINAIAASCPTGRLVLLTRPVAILFKGLAHARTAIVKRLVVLAALVLCLSLTHLSTTTDFHDAQVDGYAENPTLSRCTEVVEASRRHFFGSLYRSWGFSDVPTWKRAFSARLCLSVYRPGQNARSIRVENAIPVNETA